MATLTGQAPGAEADVRWKRGMVGAVVRDLFRLLAACRERRLVIPFPSDCRLARPRKESFASETQWSRSFSWPRGD